jgi:hypothetical protein
VGGIIRASHVSVLGQWVLYLLPPVCGVVSLVRHGIGMAPDQTKVTAVPSVLVRLSVPTLVRASMPSYARPLSSYPGVMIGERSCVFRVAKAGERVVADPGLGVGLACSA